MPLPVSQHSISGNELVEAQDGSLLWKGEIVAPGPTSPSALWANAPPPRSAPGGWWDFFDDFQYQASATASEQNTWTSMDDGGTGTNAFQNLAGGWYNIVTAAAQDDYHGIRSVSKLWLPVAAKPMWFEARFSVTEAATNKSGLVFGLTDTVTTGGLQTGASGPLANFNGIVLYKNEGTMVLNGMTSNATTQNTALALGTMVTATATRVGFYFDGAATTSNVTFYTDVGAGWVEGATKTITLAGLAQAYLIATVKAGAGGAAETLAMDYIRALTTR